MADPKASPSSETAVFRALRRAHAAAPVPLAHATRKIFRPSFPGPRDAQAAFFAGFRAATMCAAIATCACASHAPAPASPTSVVIAFARALDDGKPDAAYALMSDGYRKRVSLDEFRKRFAESAPELAEISSALVHPRTVPSTPALVKYGDDRQLQLEKRGERWLIATDLITLYDQSTPRAALQSFMRALERRRFDVVMRLMPEADKEGVSTDAMEATWTGRTSDELDRMLLSLRDHEHDPIELEGERATMPYGDHHAVQFIREDGSWKIQDPQ